MFNSSHREIRDGMKPCSTTPSGKLIYTVSHYTYRSPRQPQNLPFVYYQYLLNHFPQHLSCLRSSSSEFWKALLITWEALYLSFSVLLSNNGLATLVSVAFVCSTQLSLVLCICDVFWCFLFRNRCFAWSASTVPCSFASTPDDCGELVFTKVLLQNHLILLVLQDFYTLLKGLRLLGK